MIEYVQNNWSEIGVAIGALIFLADRIARLTPTQTDDKIVKAVYKLASVLSIRVPDNPGK